MEKLFQCEEKPVIKQYVRCVTQMAKTDYPHKWQTLLVDITNALNSFPNEKGVLTGLYALHGLVKKYEYEMDEDRSPLFEIHN